MEPRAATANFSGDRSDQLVICASHSLSSTTSASSASICGKVFALSTDSLAASPAGRISRKRPTALAARSAWTADLGGVGQLSIFCIGLRPSMGRQGERPGSAKLCMSMDDGHEARYGKADHGGRAALSLRRDADRRWLRIAMCSGVRDSAMPSRRHGSSNVLFSIISFMRTAPREWRRPDPRQAITAACGGRG